MVLLSADMPQLWERVVKLSFGDRPGAPPSHHIIFEVMGRYKTSAKHEYVLRRCQVANDVLFCCFYKSKIDSSRHRRKKKKNFTCFSQPTRLIAHAT